MMKILAIETSTKNLSLAISDGHSILAEHKSGSELTHSRDLIPDMDLLLRQIGSVLSDIDAFAISIGPGSFTGLRVGVSILKGLNLVTDIPIVSVPTLDVIAYNAVNCGCDIRVIVDAKKNNLYTSLYKAKGVDIIRASDYLLISADEMTDMASPGIFLLGDGVGIYGDRVLQKYKDVKLADKKLWYPDAKIVARLGAKKYKDGYLTPAEDLTPMYIYSRECNINKLRDYQAG